MKAGTKSQANRRISMLSALMLLAAFIYPHGEASAKAEIRAMHLYRVEEQIPRPPVNYFLMGRTTLFDLITDKAASTWMTLTLEYSTDGGASWKHLKDYGSTDWKTIDLPYDYHMTAVHIRVNGKFDPKIGADSRDTQVFGPYKVYHPYGPTQASYTAADDGSITVSFQDNSTMEDYYQIIRRGDGQEKRFVVSSNMAGRGTVTFTDSTTNSLKSTKYLYQIDPVFESIPLPVELQPLGTSVLAETKASLLGYLKLSSSARLGLDQAIKLPEHLKDIAVEKEQNGGGFKVIVIPFEFGVPGNNEGQAGQGQQESEQAEQTEAMEQEVAEFEQILDTAVADASSWARDDIKSAAALGLTTGDVIGNYQQPISRQHFSGLVVKLMEKLTGEVAELPGESPFNDTSDPDVLKAYQFSVIRGKSEHTFDPHANVSRQEISLMLWRIFHLTGLYGQLPVGEGVAFTDNDKVAPWASEAVDYISAVGLVNGKGGGRFDPQGVTTREAAIVLIKRAYDASIQ